MAEDWHTKVTLLEVSEWLIINLKTDRLVGICAILLHVGDLEMPAHQQGGKEPFNSYGTLSQAQCGEEAIKNMMCEDFFLLVLTSHVLAAAMELLDMKSLDPMPSRDLLPKDT